LSSSLPGFAKEVRAELLTCEREYSKLPPVAKSAPLTEIMLRVTAFCQDITDAVLGDKRNHFVQSNRALYSRFKDEIAATTPDCRPYDGDVTGHSSLVTVRHTTPHGLNTPSHHLRNCSSLCCSRSSTIGSDTWTIGDEIRVMASVQAYFQVSYKASTFSLI